VADDHPNLTVEILKQIRDGISQLETNLGDRIDTLRAELKGELVELRGAVSQQMRALREGR